MPATENKPAYVAWFVDFNPASWMRLPMFDEAAGVCVWGHFHVDDTRQVGGAASPRLCVEVRQRR